MGGREIRRVPLDWKHPRYEAGERYRWDGAYKPLYDEPFDDAMTDWIERATAWAAEARSGGTPDGWQYYAHTEEDAAWARANPLKAYAAWRSSPPEPESYRDRFTTEPTAYQIYEDVSEGTPISPVFPTEDDLIAWMMQDHEDWPALSEGASRRFLKAGSAPAAIFSPEFGFVSNAQVFEFIGKADDEE